MVKKFVLLLLLLVLLTVGAQESSIYLQVVEHSTHGVHLTDGEGQSLYLFLSDRVTGEVEGAAPSSAYSSTCYGPCASNWPPLIVDTWPVADGDALGEGIDPALLGTVEREDGSLQLAYNGWPLYYFARDRRPGFANGHGVGDVWYLVSPAGEGIGLDVAAEADVDGGADFAEEMGEAAAVSEEELAMQGESVYRTDCTACHGRQGEGGTGPPLADNDNLGDTRHVVRQILFGGHLMPAFGRDLSDLEAAAVATYVRNTWANDYGLVSETEVADLR